MREGRWGSLGILIAVSTLLAACAPVLEVALPDAAAYGTVARGERAIVLLRHSVTRDGTPYDDSDSRGFSFGNIDKTGLVADAVSLRSPSDAALKEGWLYMLLEPGTYYFLAYPPGMQQNPPAVAYHVDSGRYGRLANRTLKIRDDVFWFAFMQRFLIAGPRPEDFEPIPGFLLQVPRGGSVYYVGSLNISCGTIPGLLGRLTDACGPFEVADETERARGISASTFGANIPFATRILTRYGQRAPTLGPAEIKVADLAVAVEPGVRGGLTGAPPGPTLVIPGSGGSVASGRAIGVFNVLMALGQIAEGSSMEAEARARAEELAPCFRRLEDAIAPDTVVASLQRALAENVVARGIGLDKSRAAGTKPSALIRASWLGSGLRECVQAGTFCVEIAVRARLEEQAEDVARYDATLVYTNDYQSDPRKSSYRLYQVAVPQRSTCRPVEAYCDADGVALLRREIEAGIRHIAARIAADLTAPR